MGISSELAKIDKSLKTEGEVLSETVKRMLAEVEQSVSRQICSGRVVVEKDKETPEIELVIHQTKLKEKVHQAESFLYSQRSRFVKEEYYQKLQQVRSVARETQKTSIDPDHTLNNLNISADFDTVLIGRESPMIDTEQTRAHVEKMKKDRKRREVRLEKMKKKQLEREMKQEKRSRAISEGMEKKKREDHTRHISIIKEKSQKRTREKETQIQLLTSKSTRIEKNPLYK